jgi:hypothetical protein
MGICGVKSGISTLPNGGARTVRAYTPLEKTAATAVFDPRFC